MAGRSKRSRGSEGRSPRESLVAAGRLRLWRRRSALVIQTWLGCVWRLGIGRRNCGFCWPAGKQRLSRPCGPLASCPDLAALGATWAPARARLAVLGRLPRRATAAYEGCADPETRGEAGRPALFERQSAVHAGRALLDVVAAGQTRLPGFGKRRLLQPPCFCSDVPTQRCHSRGAGGCRLTR